MATLHEIITKKIFGSLSVLDKGTFNQKLGTRLNLPKEDAELIAKELQAKRLIHLNRLKNRYILDDHL